MATPQIPWTERFCAEQWKVSNRVPHIRRNPMAGFSVLTKYFGADFMQRDTSHVHRLALGLDSEAGTAISMPTGDIVVFSFDKSRGHGPHDKEAVRFLDALHPHLGRAGLIATRVGVERGLATAAALQMIGLPAAVLNASGRTIATNTLFDALSHTFLAAVLAGVPSPTRRRTGAFPMRSRRRRIPCNRAPDLFRYLVRATIRPASPMSCRCGVAQSTCFKAARWLLR